MELKEIVDEVMSLNKDGIALCERGKYKDALIEFKEAAIMSLFLRHKSPDYWAFSVANQAYCIRRGENDKQTALELLSDALDRTHLMLLETKIPRTFFGKARLNEELGLVLRYSPDPQNIELDLRQSLFFTERSLNLYKITLNKPSKRSSYNPTLEIIPKEFLQEKYFRLHGMFGIASLLLSEAVDDIAERLILKSQAEVYASKELEMRLEFGEEDGFGLVNAYHTSGIVQTETDKFEAAKENLLKAEELVKKEKLPMVASVIRFNKLWLTYKQGLNNDILKEQLDVIVHDQHVEGSKWDKGVRDYYSQRILEVANRVNSQYGAEVYEEFK
ncbi:MAG: hypothetical protein KKF65_06920 [Nanoarchaeota archaeon]|nr:hypothetical protein [Nanoarchaeota archaeon]